MSHAKSGAKNDAKSDADQDAFEPAWDAVLLVCRDCRKRSSGPSEPKPKALLQALKNAVRAEHPRPRVLLSNCLGLCPKKATAVTRVGGKQGGARMAAVTSIDGAQKAMAR